MRFYALRKKVDLLDKPVLHILVYSIIAICISVCFFYFQHYFLLLYRRLQLSSTYNTDYFLSKKTIFYLSIVFAGNAVLLGNSVLMVLLSLESRVLTKEKLRRSKIRNNQAFLIGCYYFFAFKILFITYASSDYIVLWEFGLAHYFLFLYPLLFLTLFLESSKDLRRFSKNYALQKVGIHFFVLIALSFLIGQLRKDDYEVTHRQLAKSNPYVAIPTVDNYDTQNLLTFHADVCDTHFKVINNNGKIFIDRFGSKFPINQVGQLMMESCNHFRDAGRSRPIAFCKLRYKDENHS